MRIKQLVTYLGLGLALELVLVPRFAKVDWVKSALLTTNNRLLVGVFLALVLSLYLVWTSVRSYISRYRSTSALSNSPTLTPDNLALVLMSFVATGIVFQDYELFSASRDVCVFLAVVYVLLLTYLTATYYLPSRRKDKEAEVNAEVGLSDEPISAKSQDILGRAPFVDRLYDEITKLPLTDSFVFGLSGKWGEGKSSVVNLLNNKLRTNDDFVLVEYTPWYYETKDAQLNAFYGLIEESLNKKLIVPNLRRVLAKYQQVIKNGISLSKLKLKFEVKENSPKELKSLLEGYLSITNKKLVIVIDELDRLQPDELMFVFQLVRLNTNLKNTVFLLVFDQDIVVRNMPEPYKNDKNYLEKIIQKQLTLPEINTKVIDDLIGKGIDELLKQLKVSKADIAKLEKDFPNIYQSLVKVFIKTVRSAKRYLNNVTSSLPAVVNEVDIKDFLIMELLALVAPKIYKDIWEHPWFYIPTDWTSNFGSFLQSPYSYSFDDKQKYPDIREHVQALLDELPEKEAVKELLETVFFVEVKNAFANNKTGHDGMISSYRKDQRITHPDVFKKYFYQSVPDDEISDDYLKSLLNQWANAPTKAKQKEIIKKSFEEVKKLGKLLELIKRLKVFYGTDYKELSLTLIEAIVENIDLFSKDGGERWNTEFEQATALIMIVLNDTVPNKRTVQSVLKKIVTTSEDYVLVAEAIHWAQQQNSSSVHHVYESANIPVLKTEANKRLKKAFLDTGQNIFTLYPNVSEWGFLLFQWATGWEKNRKPIAAVNDYLYVIFKADLPTFKKFLKTFLMKSHSWDGNATEEYRLSEISVAYDLTKLKDVANEHLGKSISARDKTFLRKFVSAVDSFQTPQDTSS